MKRIARGIAWLALVVSAGFSAGLSAADDVPLSVMSFNIRLPVESDGPDYWETRKPLAVEMLREQAPDVVGLQELVKSQADYLARVEAALAEEPEAGMTLLGRTVSWTETNDEGRTLICAVELQERGAFPRYVKAVYRLVTDEGEPDGEERLFDAAGEL